MSGAAIVWFRQDLRLADNPALATALSNHERVIPVFVHVDNDTSHWEHGAASRWWLHHSLESLAQSLREQGSRLIIRTGDDCLSIIQELIDQTKTTHVYWNRLYEPHHIKRDKSIKQALQIQNIEVNSFNSVLLYEP